MSSTTSIPAALSSEFRPYNGLCWRVVESQYIVATVPLVDTLDEQGRLEELLDLTKPPVPADCRHLHPLLYTPFRYTPRQGSRFRRAGQREGAFYTAEQVETAIAELAFYRLLFFAEAPEMTIPQGFAEYTAFSVSIMTDSMLDITASATAALTHLSDYSASQVFADAARTAGASGIRATSVRCPKRGATLTWLTCAVFAHPEPQARQSWHMRVTQRGVQAICESPRVAIQFNPEVFAADPRVTNFSWTRAP